MQTYMKDHIFKNWEVIRKENYEFKTEPKLKSNNAIKKIEKWLNS